MTKPPKGLIVHPPLEILEPVLWQRKGPYTIIRQATGETVCYLNHSLKWDTDFDANLIVKAPELLFTLSSVVNWADTHLVCHPQRKGYIEGTRVEFNTARRLIKAITEG